MGIPINFPKRKIARIDECMHNLIYFINTSVALRTLACCCGHNRYPMTVVVQNMVTGEIYEFMTGEEINRDKLFYKKDKQGYYYIPEVMVTASNIRKAK